MRFRTLPAAALLCTLLALLAPAAAAQTAFAGSQVIAYATGEPGHPARAASPTLMPADAPAELVLSGRIASLRGPLAGAVIILTATNR